MVVCKSLLMKMDIVDFLFCSSAWKHAHQNWKELAAFKEHRVATFAAGVFMPLSQQFSEAAVFVRQWFLNWPLSEPGLGWVWG